MPTQDEFLNTAFKDTVESLVPDTMLLLHGAGDVANVDPETAHLVSTLTVEYMAKLCDAAIDAHQMLLPAGGNQSLASLPIPPFRKSRQPPKPAPSINEASSSSGNNDPLALPRRKRRARDVFWDEPIATPKIRGVNVDAAKKQQRLSLSSQTSTGSTTSVAPSEWVGVAGVDFFEDRTRAAYIQSPMYLSTQSFLFPICHDVYTYGRIRQLQATRQSKFLPLLQDSVVADLVQQEGKQQWHILNKKKKKRNEATDAAEEDAEEGNDEEDGDDTSSVDAEDKPVWPGLEDLIPVNGERTKPPKV